MKKEPSSDRFCEGNLIDINRLYLSELVILRRPMGGSSCRAQQHDGRRSFERSAQETGLYGMG